MGGPASAEHPVVPVVHTSAANVASVCAALERAGVRPELTRSPETCARAERLVLPGVGSFGAVAGALGRAGLLDVLRQRIAASRPTLCVCLGMQLLARDSGEAPGVPGLGVIDPPVRRFAATPGLRVPQLGWNRVTPEARCAMLTPGDAYFANSYRLTEAPAGWAAAWASHGGPFVAALERGGVLATQFHPELSGAWGAALIERWLERSAEAAGDVPPVDRPASEPPPAHPGDASVMPRVIPCLDVRDGRVVKGVRFQGLRDAGDPVERAAAYEAQGADELVILDVSATPEGRAHAAETVDAVRRVLSIPLTVGGGVRRPDDARRLLDAGADKVGVNTAAVERPELVRELAETFGVQCTVVAVDAARRDDLDAGATPGDAWEVVTRSGTNRTGVDAVEWCARCEQLGAGEILLTSWDRDGTRTGYDLELLRATAGRVALPVIASGGVNDPGHLAEGVEAGATGVLAASIFHDDDWTVEGVKRAMGSAAGARWRTAAAGAKAVRR